MNAPRTRRRQAGFTLLEIAIASTLLLLVGVNVATVLRLSTASESDEAVATTVDDQAMRVLDRIAYAVMGSDRSTLFPDPESPVYTTSLRYTVSLGVDKGEVQWADPEQIAYEGDGNRVVWCSNPGVEDERRVVWCNLVRPFLGGELPNGIDDNGNGLIDERGLSFELSGDSVTIRLTLESRTAEGRTVTRTVETVATCRN